MFRSMYLRENSWPQGRFCHRFVRCRTIGPDRAERDGGTAWLAAVAVAIKFFTGNGIANPVDIFFEGIELTMPIDSLILLRL